MLAADASGLSILTAPSDAAGCTSPIDDHRPAVSTSDSPAAYQIGNRWSDTATSSSGANWGDTTQISWSIVPDGTWIPGSTGEPSSPSDFVTFMNGLYGSVAGDVEQQPWFSLVESVFDRWSDVSGLDFVYELQDDGAAFSDVASRAPGVAGVRGDIRIGGHAIDGDSGTLAYNFFPDNGEMVLDTSDSYFQELGEESLRLRNVMSHELGHGIGLSHVDPVDQTKLMEPIASNAFDGPQLDDILAAHRLYGDPMESGQGNDSFQTATNLGNISNRSISVGDESTGQFLSIDGVTDEDYFRFAADADSELQVQLVPLGDSYSQAAVGGSTSAFDAKSQNDLRFEIYEGQSTRIASIDLQGLGVEEHVSEVRLAAGREYYVRVSGDRDAAQMYRLDLSSTAIPASAAQTIDFSSQEIHSYGGAQDHSGSAVAEQGGSTLHLTGNRWVTIDLPYTITPRTMLEFDFSSSSQGDIHGIGLDANTEIDSRVTFRLYGEQDWGLADFAQYRSPGSMQHFTIPVGQYYTGDVANLFFVNDHDVTEASADSLFSKVRVYEADVDAFASSPPRVRNDAFSIDEDSSTVAVDVLANDLVLPSAVSIASVSQGTAGGYVSIAADGRLHYRPAPDFNGTETFSYTLSNSSGDSTGTVTATIRPVNDAPAAKDNQYSVETGGVYRMDVLQNDSTGPDAGETLRLVSTSDGSAGGAVCIEADKVLYTPSRGFVGAETFTYTVSDGSPGGVATATVTVRVLPPADEAVDFNAYRIDPYGGRQDRVGAALAEDGGVALRLLGNTWKKIDLPYTITPNTILEFDFASSSQGEIHGIGLDDNATITSARTFRIAGSQDWGVDDFANYAGHGELVHYVIPVGQYYTGAVAHLFFVNDQDVASPDAMSVFRHVRVYEAEELASFQAAGHGDQASEEQTGTSTEAAVEDRTLFRNDAGTPMNFRFALQRFRAQRQVAEIEDTARLRVWLGGFRRILFVVHDLQNGVEVETPQDGSHVRLQVVEK